LGGENNRILLTHDRATLADYAYERVSVANEMPGVFILNDRFPVGQAIQEILLLASCSEQAEWSGERCICPFEAAGAGEMARGLPVS
jgi:hypothetical protein